MKTPRDILLQRHESAQPKLDAIRQQVLNSKVTTEQSGRLNFVSLFLGCLKNVWNELVLPSRRIWAGLAACWMLLGLVNLSMGHRSHVQVAAATPEMFQAYRQQERLLAELIGPNESRIADSQRKFVPQPRSGRRLEILTT
ncbi:MAG TPA: hypothetical protein VN625_03975 [Desulfuromonadaceae bacterium]|nr:hypothetical protein [Desulfuromonadaceae bacterium]